MSDLKQPTMCCCLLPRPGIMLFTLSYTAYAFSGMFFLTLGYILTQNIAPHQVEDQDERSVGLSDMIFTWEHMANVICGFIYFYTFILAYKRKWESFEYALRALMAIALFGVYECYDQFKFMFLIHSQVYGPKPDEVDDNVYAEFQNSYPSASESIVFGLIVYVIPWIIQLYLIKQTRTYIKYVLYKKGEKNMSSSSEKVKQ
ncbi:hypothetical protein BCR42DRAFT_414523 [Absidia repens]|uniref:Uncharacterized protein n=1 Tax=Absidia repens TaxID=90262 RepID=A0A1X2IJ76_9FUNG|nr:hypothetical protein BCR42DRAFT_414523 [Absidia repens]